MMYIRIAPHPATKVKINVMPHQTCDSSGDLSKGVAHKDIYNFQNKETLLTHIIRVRCICPHLAYSHGKCRQIYQSHEFWGPICRFPEAPS